MRRIEFSRRPEEASCGVRHELLNRGSQVRILSPAPHPPTAGQVRLKRDDRPSPDAPALYCPVAMPSLNRYK